MSFRLKLILGIASLQTVLLLVLVASSLDFLRASNEEELQKRADTTARLFASATKDALLATDLASLESSVAELMTNPDIAYARVSGGRGALAQGGDPRVLARPFRADARIGEVDDGVFDAGAAIDVLGVAYGRVEIGFSIDRIDAVLRQARTQAMSLAALAIGVVTLFSFALGLYLTRGLDALTRGSRRLSAGELGYQIGVRGTDELAQTARAFNDMSRGLETAAAERRRVEAELADYRDHLEQLVAQRTEALTQANAALQQTNRKLEAAHNQLLQSEKMASIGQLAAGVAHEINNPIGFVISNMNSLEQYLRQLTRVIGAYEQNDELLARFADRFKAIETVKREVELDFLKDDALALLAESNDGLQRVKKIVRDLKDFSHVGEGEWQRVDIHRGLDSTLNIIASELKRKATVVKSYGRLPEVECMPLELNQVFMNLLVNAGQAIAERGEITIGTGVESEEVWIDIADTGSGIAPENLKRIFDPFFTTKSVGVGTGLGLSVSYSIVKKHHGRLEVKSQVGQGSRFRLWLPLRQEGRDETSSD